MKYLIRGGRLVDPVNNTDKECDISISGGRVECLGEISGGKFDAVIEAKGRIVVPGLVDMHTHLREPGREDKETVASGTRAAVRGGFTTVACMPNTEPAIDSVKTVELVKEIAKRDAICGVAVVGAITRSREGEVLVDMAALKKAGVVALSDDGSSVDDDALMEQALKCAKANKLLLIGHCEVKELSAGGMINKGFISTKMGLRGIPASSEYEAVKRDIELTEKFGASIHIAHVSCAESVKIIREAKLRGVKVTAETTPHYFALTDECCVTYDTNTKMNPPLRTAEDVKAIKKGLADGTIDAIATDHAPHTDSEKDVEFDFAPFGIIGLETALSLAVMELIEGKVLSWSDLVMKLSVNPARILGLDCNGLKIGAAADIAVIDPDREYLYKKDAIESKSKNSPFINWKMKAKVTDVFVGGRPAMLAEKIKTK